MVREWCRGEGEGCGVLAKGRHGSAGAMERPVLTVVDAAGASEVNTYCWIRAPPDQDLSSVGEREQILLLSWAWSDSAQNGGAGSALWMRGRK